jgi:ABC-type glutathione transport system ATPase component
MITSAAGEDDVEVAVSSTIPGGDNGAIITSISRLPNTNFRNDPFAPREGRPLRWRNVHMTVQVPDMNNGKKGATKNKAILDNVYGEVPVGEITAILGPSGSGTYP